MPRAAKGKQNAKPQNNDQGESLAAYFRKVFDENPKLLWERSNALLLARWLQDHPGHQKVPERVKVNLSNIKRVLPKKWRKPGRKPGGATAAAPVEAAPAVSPLEVLEIQIDECLVTAKNLDRQGLEEVINYLRRARNAVVWKIGQ